MKSRLTIVGLLIGLVLGFLLRPAVPLLGQVPFSTVIARGANLHGLDQLLVGYARISFRTPFFLFCVVHTGTRNGFSILYPAEYNQPLLWSNLLYGGRAAKDNYFRSWQNTGRMTTPAM